MSETGTKLRNDLAEELARESLDYDRILDLAGQLAAEDPSFVRFTVDARHIGVVGRQLVAKQETALAELVKNAYDADATNVDLIFSEAHHPGGTLEITDDGVGMTREQLSDGFMQLSTRDKIDNPKSQKFGRRRAGRKGIGRFAAQRLGRQLSVLTQTHGSDHALCIDIDWDDFEAKGDLTHVKNRVSTVIPRKKAGTTLRIGRLRDGWSNAKIQQAHRYVSELLQPFPLGKGTPGDTVDPGFRAAFYRSSPFSCVI